MPWRQRDEGGVGREREGGRKSTGMRYRERKKGWVGGERTLHMKTCRFGSDKPRTRGLAGEIENFIAFNES